MPEEAVWGADLVNLTTRSELACTSSRRACIMIHLAGSQRVIHTIRGRCASCRSASRRHGLSKLRRARRASPLLRVLQAAPQILAAGLEEPICLGVQLVKPLFGLRHVPIRRDAVRRVHTDRRRVPAHRLVVKEHRRVPRALKAARPPVHDLRGLVEEHITGFQEELVRDPLEILDDQRPVRALVADVEDAGQDKALQPIDVHAQEGVVPVDAEAICGHAFELRARPDLKQGFQLVEQPPAELLLMDVKRRLDGQLRLLAELRVQADRERMLLGEKAGV
eukprot:CAMPEP_0203931104 /NCGR_PEP_ID=MMETSP0359-20131031/69724_1 /ASSEMBLY_ACC=CAM_ASM_000338 /TAXON_ID=268821 /ORGANISM="Scrippsiella Hangoei, Strain SHTV-5" /LENGTH=278 /DNA_ID=CAMNT_0050860381 /DNA_START=175 /DNA_END=1012 /DNA_ORIENTATION=+